MSYKMSYTNTLSVFLSVALFNYVTPEWAKSTQMLHFLDSSLPPQKYGGKYIDIPA